MKGQLQHPKKPFYKFIIPVITAILVFVPISIYPIYADSGYFIYHPLVQNCPSPALPLINGDFELGGTGWSHSPYFADFVPGGDGITPHGGNLMAFTLNYGIDGVPSGYIEQSFSIPICSPYLSFWWSSSVSCSGVSGNRCGGDLSLSIDDALLTSLHVAGGGIRAWEKIVVDMSSYQGSIVKVRFTAVSFRDSITNYIDDIIFQNNLLP